MSAPESIPIPTYPVVPVAPPPFDVATAQHFLTCLNGAEAALERTHETRRRLGNTATKHWEGQYREDFDIDHGYSMRRMTDSISRLRSVARQVMDSIADAQQMQHAYQRAVDDYAQQMHAYEAAQERARQQVADLERNAAKVAEKAAA